MPRTALLIALVVALSGCSASAGAAQQEVFYNAAYPAYASVSDIGAAADLVIEGTVTSSEVRELDIVMAPSDGSSEDPKLNPGGEAQALPMVYTVHTVRVASVIKGKSSTNASIEVKELGGLLKGTLYRTSEGVVLKDQKVYVMYLKTYDGSPATLVNPLQGAYPVENGRVSALPGNTLPPGDVPRR